MFNSSLCKINKFLPFYQIPYKILCLPNLLSPFLSKSPLSYCQKLSLFKNFTQYSKKMTNFTFYLSKGITTAHFGSSRIINRNIDIMAKYDFFISYSSKDKEIADRIVKAIESTNHLCWIAPRNIPFGTPYARGIMDGIDNSSTFLVLITENSIKSEDVLNEVDNAHALKKKIIPIRLSDIQLPRELNYYISRNQWINLSSKNPEKIIFLLDLDSPVVNVPIDSTPDTKTPPPTFWEKYKSSIILISAFVVICLIGLSCWKWYPHADSTNIGNGKPEKNTLPLESIIKSDAGFRDKITPPIPINDTTEQTQIPLPGIGDSLLSANKEFKDLIAKAESNYRLKQFDEALPLFIKIADKHNINYACQVGYMYENGEGTEVSIPKAIEWYKKAADNGNRNAQLQAAHLLLSEELYSEGTQYYLEAERYYELHGTLWNLSSIYLNDLGLVYYNGYGTIAPDKTKAKTYFTNAARDNNNKAAKYNLETLY